MTTALASRPTVKSPTDTVRADLDGPERLAIDADRFGELISVSARTIFRLESAGKLPRSFLIGGSRRWRAAEVRAWIDAGCPARKEWERRAAP